MKKLIFTVLTVCGIAGMAITQANGFGLNAIYEMVEKKALFKWEETAHDFGKIPQGVPVTLTYKFKNSGNAPLVVTNVVASCGCTTTDYSKEAIAPGKKGFVTISYNAAAVGTFSKSVSVLSNASEAPIILTFNGEVVSK